MTTFPACLSFTLGEEGGFTTTLADDQTATNQGITLSTLSAFCDFTCSVADLRAMPPSLRNGIYRSEYWDKVNGDALPLGVNLMAFDFGVTAGPETSAMFLQGVVGAEEDGSIGPMSLAAIAKVHPADTINILAARQLEHYRALPSFGLFGAGWVARTGRRQRAAGFMAIGS